jgi:replication initiation protein RepC
MQTECALGAQRGSFAGAPTGFRRLTPSLLQVDRAAHAFDGLPEGVTVPGQVLAALKAAAPRLGLAPRLVHAIDWLFKFTQPQDWGRGGRPIVWPSSSMQQEALGLSASQVKATNRALIEAGLITMKDSPNGKRYGKRVHPKGPIVEAYGFDLSPLAARYAEFMRLAAEAKAERIEMGRLRRRATIARNGIAQVLETAAEYGFTGEEWTNLIRESRNLTLALRQIERPEEMTLGVESLERRQAAARERLESLLAAAAPVASDPVNSDPKGPENRPHQYTYKPSLYPEQDTVTTSEGCKSDRVGDRAEPERPERPHEQPGGRESGAGEGAAKSPPVETHRTDSGTVMRLSIDELMLLAPRLRGYLKTPSPAWPEIVDAADWLRGDLGVSKSLWSDACRAMGREQAAIAIAIVSAKPAEHFRSTPGGYFHGMVAKAKAGELNLGRTIWGLRQAVAAKPRHGSGRGRGSSGSQAWS